MVKAMEIVRIWSLESLMPPVVALLGVKKGSEHIERWIRIIAVGRCQPLMPQTHRSETTKWGPLVVDGARKNDHGSVWAAETSPPEEQRSFPPAGGKTAA